MHPGMTHYPQRTPVRVPDIVNAMRDPGFLPNAWGKQLGAGNALYDAYQSQNALQKMGVLPGIGDVAGFAGDMQMMYQNPEERTTGNALMAGAGLLPFVPAGMTAWHGSPHLFDRFRMSQVGTGEGAQVYGHGLYLAESPGVAKTYRHTQEPSFLLNGKEIEFSKDGDLASILSHTEKEISDGLSAGLDQGAARQVAIDKLESAMDGTRKRIAAGEPGYKNWLKTQERVVSELKAGSTIERGRAPHLYKVDIPDEHVAKMLDWDKPLSEQPESIRKALSNMPSGKRVSDMSREELIDSLKYVDSNGVYDDADSIAEFGRPATLEELRATADNMDLQYYLDTNIGADPYATGKSLYKQLTSKYGGGNAWSNEAQAKASEYLNSLGIPGIRYLDATSRGAGEGTRNMVLFDEGLANILERNGEQVNALAPTGLGTVKKTFPEKKISQLADKYGEVDFPQRNYQGGQQVNLITPSGKFIQSNESSHNNMLKRVGIEESIEDFMGETGVIRMHDTDNYEIWGKPTREQMKSIFDASGGDAYIDIMNPQTGESLFSDLVSMDSYADLQRVINQSFGKK